jgi:DNA-binding beta-propeller fold protein YncE
MYTRSWMMVRRFAMPALLIVSTYALEARPAQAKGSIGAAALAVNASNGQVYAAYYGSHKLTVLDGATGALVRTITLGVRTPVAVAADAADDRIYVTSVTGTANGMVSTIEAHNGRLLRTAQVGPFPQMIVVASQVKRAFVLGGSTDEAPDKPGAIAILDAGTGRLLRTLTLHAIPVTAAVFEPARRLFVVASTFSAATGAWLPKLAMYDAADGRLLRTIALPSFISAVHIALAVDTRTARVFVTYNSLTATGDGFNVSTLDAMTGNMFHTIRIRPPNKDSVGMIPSAIAIDPMSGRVVVAGYDESTYAGSLTLLDPSSGVVLRTLSAGVGKAPIALAPSADGHLLVVNGTSGSGDLVTNGGVRILSTGGGMLPYHVPVTFIPSAVAVVGRLAFLLDSGETIEVLDMRSGHILNIL